ncbi:MAG: carbohydrate ABC transporter substrate-binding protein [Oscillospiraceae bacterium]|nr:carbohydrate ABC transporter substrate-binding protein [Oscillospiraceae bacterium]
MRKQILAFVTAACLLLAGCRQEAVVTQQKEPVHISLSWWGNDVRTEYTIEGVEVFERLHPDIKVDVSYSEWSGYESRNRIQMFSKTEADVMQINFGWLSEFSPEGEGYYDLDAISDQFDVSNFDESFLGYGRRGGKLNGIPIAMNAETVYVNKTLYDQYGLDIPETWEDLEEAAKVMSPDGVYPMSGADKALWLYTIAYAEQVTGRKILRDDGSLNFSPNELRVMILFYQHLVDAKIVPQMEYYDRLNIQNGVYAGTVAWVSDAVNYCGAAMESGYEYIAAPYTHTAETPEGAGWYAKPASLYAVSKNTQHPKEAAMLLDFLLNNEDMAIMQGVEKGVPLSTSARQALDQDGQLSGLQYEASLCMESCENLSPINAFIENADLYAMFYDACNLVLYEKATPEEAAGQLYLDIKHNFNK